MQPTRERGEGRPLTCYGFRDTSDGWTYWDGTRTFVTLCHIDANVAAVYLKARQHLPVTFAPKVRPHIPPAWRSFVQRSSVLADVQAPRSAADPVNAARDLAYTLLYVEAVRACHALGLDPGLGDIHRDKKGRTPSPSTWSSPRSSPATTSSRCARAVPLRRHVGRGDSGPDADMGESTYTAR